jgi:hypothetical protein
VRGDLPMGVLDLGDVSVDMTRRVAEVDPGRPHYIRTELGVGYRLAINDESAVEGSPETSSL